MFALYVRHWRLVGLLVAYIVLNPVVFREPTHTDAWISRSVLGERQWSEDGHSVFEANRPGILNALNALAYSLGIYGVYRRKAVLTAIGGDPALSFKLAYLQEMVEYYDARNDGSRTNR